jgi:hypothetical protein
VDWTGVEARSLLEKQAAEFSGDRVEGSAVVLGLHIR